MYLGEILFYFKVGVIFVDFIVKVWLKEDYKLE